MNKSQPKNRLFVSDKPAGVSSNQWLSRLKHKYKDKKAGFSGTLDPFASGALIIGFGQYTKLFRFLDKSPKTYQATLFLGAASESLDTEKIYKVRQTPSIPLHVIRQTLNELIGEVEYLPPKYSAKKIDGQRAYKLARMGEDVQLKKIKSTISKLHVVNYCHPFLTFLIEISEGGYVRSIGEIIAQKLGTNGALSALRRKNEGKFIIENEKLLNPWNYIALPQNWYLQDEEDLVLGRKLDTKNFKIQKNGIYKLQYAQNLGIISLMDCEVKYLLNKVNIC